MKKKNISNRSVSLKNRLIIAFLGVLLIPSIIIAISSYMSAANKVESQMVQNAEKNVDLVSQTVDQFVSAQQENIDYLSNAIQAADIENDSDARTRELLDTIQDSKADVEQTFIGTETGQFMNSPTSFKNPPDYDPRERPWYQQAMEDKGNVIVTDPYVSKSSEQVVVTLAKATADNQGVVAVNLELGSLTDMTNQVSIGKEGYLFLLDGTNHYISHPTNEAGSEATEDFFQDIQANESGSFDYSFEGEQKKLAFATSDVTGWKVVGTMYQSEVTSAVMPILITTIIVIAIAILLGGAVIFFIIRSINKPISDLVNAADRISDGDLSVNVDVQRNDELGKLGEAFNKMRDNLSNVILQVREKASGLAASSEQLNASTEQNTSATEQISSSIQEVASGMDSQSSRIVESTQMAEEMSKSIQQIAESSNEVSSTTASASSAVKEGNKAIETTVGQMEYIKQTVNELSGSIQGLGSHSKEISKIVDVITDIAEQTNLLALNAAIEAARAGEHGKGFAVVADEVRKLAEQSAQSTDQIRQMIGTIQTETSNAVESMKSGTEEVEKGITVVHHAGESFTEITGFVTTVSQQIEQVTSKIQEIASGTEQFVSTFEEVAKVADFTSDGAQNVSASTEEQLASMEEISGSATSLSQMAEELQDLVKQFKI
ncbi:HAMP domain-containing protein [Sediminibacillus dalangtanensis]|uniref:HAMP domain-containing protein n=1 Tax=Sediminibacillus dalangtanensis TaxID=2729421 RepID=A0ABX7VTF1_9BACI|nr:methyl-accepting chemotaxis protein [Sediminibacillus dalangtanensis]QTM98895.1 HAMP domain-containing protein [Sediminibacillus dalangtanensis]